MSKYEKREFLMDTIVGYVTYIFDDNTVKIHITDKYNSNESDYSVEEKVKISGWDMMDSYKDVFDIRISLIHNLLHKKVMVRVLDKDNIEGVFGRVKILTDSAA